MASELPFKNVDPQTREQRLASKDKDRLEKTRLQQRGQQPPKNVLVPEKQSPMYIDDYQRFQGDAAQQEFQRRQAAIQRKEDIYERKRAENYYREKSRWDNMQTNVQRAEQRLQHKREEGTGALRNKSSEHYNIITLNYENSREGQTLKHQDETTMYKSQVRAANLYAKGNSVTHNIITGAPVSNPLGNIHRPVAPWEK
mmetsp:Transcript_24377/g.53264  ORF Transcript_24377/g.53264 Transcript_24377/m.53264 type:complete len:199 (+) Transcript_24377:253-849(+)|eukprot:CAMPEP_0202907044 /NCGR_PEP_ID=MMETSP1392-20130828/41077_1 /ASSEMBLY_ACC=CAM_ASM_000868 /TAXON_ID=225041 /ORGANISM="Chlamydomonas chlamydogama, Strain SAG 11-48b" /LENGTH=198 /DNA_ID=CAMNT_0049595779 /DNA_START=229 /DNA_END=825 /DNA_ORIENTATION=+